MRLHNRQVKASFWNDPDLLQWPREKRWFYLGLVQLADDSGCLENSPFAFKIHLFPSPLDADITPELLAQWVNEMIEQGKLKPYAVNGKQYLFVANFHKHQTPDYPTPPSKASIPLPPWVQWVEDEEKKRKGRYVVVETPRETLPAPQGVTEETPLISRGNPGETPPINITVTVTETVTGNLKLNTCASPDDDARLDDGQTTRDENSGRAAGQDPGGSVEAEKVTATPGEQRAKTPLLEKPDKPRPPFTSKKQEQLFDQFWAKYPKKRGKGQAEKVWVKMRPSEELFALIMDKLEVACRSPDWQKDSGQFIPYPATWLNRKGWEDEYTAGEVNPVDNQRTKFREVDYAKSYAGW